LRDLSNVTNLADRLKAKRRERGISQSQAARELEVARTAYRLWEMEAARPAPDRWRLVARWLGVSVSTLLLSEGLISGEEATESEVAADEYESFSGETQDLAAERETGDFFEQAQLFIDRAIEKGVFTAQEAGNLRGMIRRIEKGLAASPPEAAQAEQLPSPSAGEGRPGQTA
jgi:transcriptional regulator with XRE-family HTH domain